jgi:hypothetical protein
VSNSHNFALNWAAMNFCVNHISDFQIHITTLTCFQKRIALIGSRLKSSETVSRNFQLPGSGINYVRTMLNIHDLARNRAACNFRLNFVTDC